MTVTHEQLMRIIFCSVLLVFAFDVLAITRAPESFQKEDIDNGINYLFQVRPLFRETDILFFRDHQLLPMNSYSDLDRLYLWTTPIDVAQKNVRFNANTVLPLPLYTTYPKDNLFNSPLTPLLSPARKGIYAK